MSEAAAINRSPDYTSSRRWQRYKVNVLIRVIVSRAMKASIFDGSGTSLSEGGMALFAGAEFRLGDQVAVEFTPPFSSPPIRVDAKICNRTGYHYGVEFLAVDPAQRQSVAQLRMHLASFAVMA
ncbi:MAG: PilZ domain-containing protein [Terriglobales bacterium]